MKRVGEFLGVPLYVSEAVEADTVYILTPPEKPPIEVVRALRPARESLQEGPGE